MKIRAEINRLEEKTNRGNYLRRGLFVKKIIIRLVINPYPGRSKS